MKIQRGVMVMRNGKAWGITYEDGHSTHYGWMDPEDAEIYDPQYCKAPTNATYPNSHYIPELSLGIVVPVERRIEVVIDKEKP